MYISQVTAFSISYDICHMIVLCNLDVITHKYIWIRLNYDNIAKMSLFSLKISASFGSHGVHMDHITSNNKSSR